MKSSAKRRTEPDMRKEYDFSNGLLASMPSATPPGQMSCFWMRT